MAPCHGNGKSKEEWVKFLQKFAFEELNFGRGQNPRPGTWADSEFEKIKRCPFHLEPPITCLVNLMIVPAPTTNPCPARSHSTLN